MAVVCETVTEVTVEFRDKLDMRFKQVEKVKDNSKILSLSY